MRQGAMQHDSSSERAGKCLEVSAKIPRENISARTVYQALLRNPGSIQALATARRFLDTQIDLVSSLECDLPDELEQLEDWTGSAARRVAETYQQYLKARRAGAPRHYFKTRGQALAFVAKVAPTKLVDGAWLYGVLNYWKDRCLWPLVETFLEELGSGDPGYNHVLLYQKLMAEEGCKQLETLDDRYYVQGAVQLALGHHSTEFLPEVIGYNLGYEQLPLHLLITAYELDELDIDPYYFTLHVTVDNASTGHARRAVQAVIENLPTNNNERKNFLRRLKQGYNLNSVGVGSLEIITSFDIEKEVIDILKRKSYFALVHSDYCKIRGMTVNEWLSDSEQIPRFLEALVEEGWIRRNQDPDNSKFWHLLQGSKAKMFGVFSPRERGVIYEWIAGEWHNSGQADNRVFNADRQLKSSVQGRSKLSIPRAAPIPAPCILALRDTLVDQAKGVEKQKDASLQTKMGEKLSPEMMRQLIELMAPGKHHTPAGLRATRIFCNICNSRS